VENALAVIMAEGLALPSIVERAKDFAHASKAEATRRAYAADLRDFASFCNAHVESAFPASAEIVALYITNLAATKTVATINRRLVAIARAHKDIGWPNPVADPHVRSIIQGIKRTLGTAQRKKDALTGNYLKEAVLTIDTDTLRGKRDKALLLLTFFCAARRSEIAALNIEDIRFEQSGLVVTIRRSKTDQSGAGREIGVPFVRQSGICAVKAVSAWIDASGIAATGGPLFRTFNGGMKLTQNRIHPQDIARLVKRVMDEAAIDGDFAAHSLRAGFITTAASTKGVSEVDIQRVSGHRSVAVLRGYVRRASLFQDAPASVMFG
jgi:integrase